MKKLVIKRFAYTPMGTFGEMVMPDGSKLFSVEDPWRNNQPNVSCIPSGRYQCAPRLYNKGGYRALHIKNVENRSHILFHRGNTELDVQGCIVVGMRLGFIANRWAVASSRDAFELLMHNYGDTEFELNIKRFDPSLDNYTEVAPSAIMLEKDEKSTDLSIAWLKEMGVLTHESSDYELQYMDAIKVN